MEQYFGTKELYQVTLRARTPMKFGARTVEAGEPILYFERVQLAQLNENSSVKTARGGWTNMPQVIWEDRSEMTFSLSEGVMNSVGMGMLFSAKMLENGISNATYIPKREGPFPGGQVYKLEHTPTNKKPAFCYEYAMDCIQKKMNYTLDNNKITIIDGTVTKDYIFDYYYAYDADSTLYVIEKDRFNGAFSLEGKFYTKDENDGINVTNILTMPKVRVVSNINLRLGEGASPTTSVFNIIAMPEVTEHSTDCLVEILRLPEDVDADF